MPDTPHPDYNKMIPSQIADLAKAAALAATGDPFADLPANQDFVRAAIDAASAVFVEALDDAIQRRASLTAVALKHRDAADALDVRNENLLRALRDILSATRIQYPSAEDALAAIGNRATAALAADLTTTPEGN